MQESLKILSKEIQNLITDRKANDDKTDVTGIEALKNDLNPTLHAIKSNQNILINDLAVISNNIKANDKKNSETEALKNDLIKSNQNIIINDIAVISNNIKANDKNNSVTVEESSTPPRHVNPKKISDGYSALFIGDSITKSLDREALEYEIGVKVKHVKCYTVDDEPNAYYPEKNFVKMVPQELEKDSYDYLILQAPSNEINNLKEDSLGQYINKGRDKVMESNKKLFQLAQTCAIKYPSIKIVILTRIPRYENFNRDPKGQKDDLNQYANSVLIALWMENDCPDRIKIHDLELGCYGELRTKRYGVPGRLGDDGKYPDGIHLRGNLATKHYTSKMAKMFKSIFNLPTRQQHQSDPRPYRRPSQSQFQRNSWSQKPQYTGSVWETNVQQREENPGVRYNIPIANNRFHIPGNLMRGENYPPSC